MKQLRNIKSGIVVLFLSISTWGVNASESAMNNPDAFIWKVFVDINQPADLSKGRGIPDITKHIGDDAPVLWQTWMTTQEVFLDGGKTPPAWNAETKLMPSFISPARKQMFRSPRKLDLIFPDASGFKFLEAGSPPPAETSESAMNKDAFEFIVKNDLYYLEGQEKFHATGLPINLPTESKEIKSAWKLLSPISIDKISEVEIKKFKSRFHTTTLNHEEKSYLYGLTAMHITTKDLPNWLWATFEHEDNPLPELSDNDRVGQPSEFKGTKWEHYRLRGTQTDFTDSTGQPTLLANTQIEQGFQQSSSCITCHSRATIGDPQAANNAGIRSANRLPFFEVRNMVDRHTSNDHRDFVMVFGHTGAPNAEWFIPRRKNRDQTGGRGFTQLDFMWSLRNAKPRGVK